MSNIRDWSPTEQVAGHPRAPATAALSNVLRNGLYALENVGRLLVCHTPYLDVHAHASGGNTSHTQGFGVTGSFRTPLFRGKAWLPVGCTRVRARIGVALPPLPGIVVYPRVKVDDGVTTVSSGAREILASDMTVTGGTTATATVEAGHGVRSTLINQVYTTGFTANVPQTPPTHITAFTETTIVFPFISSNGSKGSGSVWVSDAQVVNTPDQPVADLRHNWYDGGRRPIFVDTTATLGAIDASATPVEVDVRVDVRIGFALGVLAAAYYPSIVMVYAERD